jgi:hypothetical protein
LGKTTVTSGPAETVGAVFSCAWVGVGVDPPPAPQQAVRTNTNKKRTQVAREDARKTMKNLIMKENEGQRKCFGNVAAE